MGEKVSAFETRRSQSSKANRGGRNCLVDDADSSRVKAPAQNTAHQHQGGGAPRHNQLAMAAVCRLNEGFILSQV